MTPQPNDSFFEQLMNHIMEGVRIPKVQIERVVGPILGMFIDEVVSTTLKEEELLSGEYVTLCPEFPLRKTSNEDDPNHSTNIDWLMYNKTKKELVFFELKTTDTTFKREQLETYRNLQSTIKEKGAYFLISNAETISSKSNENGKYRNIFSKLATSLPNYRTLLEECRTSRIFYLAPEVLRVNIEGALGTENRFFSFQDLSPKISSSLNENWQILREKLISLDSDTRNIRNGTAKTVKVRNYKFKVDYKSIITQCEINGDLIRIGFDGGVKALKSSSFSDLQSRKDYKYDDSECKQGKDLKNWILGTRFLEIVCALRASDQQIEGIENENISTGHHRFALTAVQTKRIEDYFAEQTAICRQQGEDRPDCASVTFTWTPDMGRSVTAYINGSTRGCEIE